MSKASMTESSAQGVAWDLSDLYRGHDDPTLERDLKAAKEQAVAFERTQRGQISKASGPTAAWLRAALDEFAALAELMDRPMVYASLWHAAKTDDPLRGALLARTREARTAINQHLIFFELEWIHLPDEYATPLLADPLLEPYRHFLEQKRAWRPHYLSESEEKILDDKAVTGRAALVRLFDETTSTITCPFVHGERSETLSIQQILAKLYDPDRSIRQAGAAGLTEALKSHSRLLSYLFNTLVLDHQVDTRLRRFAGPMDSRHLANEITAEVVDALLAATESSHGTVQRYYRLKARLLGVSQLCDYDRYAPVSGDLPTCSWPQAREIVTASYEAFDRTAGSIVQRFFTDRWIDAELRPGKRGGAFSSSAVPSVHPFILMNYTDKLRDVMTLAHELGHGLHQYLARGVGYLQCDTPLTTAETASVFGEMLTFRQLLERNPEPRVRLGLLCGKIEDAFATVFRQVVLTRFEQAAHRARKEEGELATPRLNELWLEANAPMHGDAVTLTEGYSWWWLYIGHFVHAPFYCYAYAFGELLVLALFNQYQRQGEAFAKQYLDLLAAGGSEAPPALLARLGVNINDPAFWKQGLKLLDDMVTEAESLAQSL
ncbi:MAG TPA: M3 family oligoendopeptidase [Gemmatales bacterium]|nr:M3 family oligoendopeptidase [Gemmatales bacterium]HMP59972.1 M3 family oligoendopeptidase [Gemmatales bacterium]